MFRKTKRPVPFSLPEGLITSTLPDGESLGTYPGIGVMNEIVEGFVEMIGIQKLLLRPPPNSLRTLDLGTRYSPEGACLPFKLILGNLLQTMEQGADTVGMITERGPCRLGLYSLVMRVVLSDLNLKVNWFDFNNADLRRGYLNLFRDVYRRTYGHNVSLLAVFRGFTNGFMRLAAVEALEKERNRWLAFEIRRGSLAECFERGRALIRRGRSPLAIRRALRRAKRELRAVPADLTRPTVKVCLLGEAYCLIDPFANSNIEARLARLGAQPCRLLWQTDYLRHTMGLDAFSPSGKKAVTRAGLRYLKEDLGGDATSNIGHALLAHRRGDDGMIHLKPFGCMVEFVAENLLQVVQDQTGFPIMSITVDDLTGEERINVRLEAFIDNLFRRKYGHPRRES